MFLLHDGVRPVSVETVSIEISLGQSIPERRQSKIMIIIQIMAVSFPVHITKIKIQYSIFMYVL
jgi:hypothetical protein